MSDILDELRWLDNELVTEGENLHSEEIAVVAKAISEIERLRSTIDQLRGVAGAVSVESGLTFKDIKQGLPQSQNPDVMLKTNG